MGSHGVPEMINADVFLLVRDKLIAESPFFFFFFFFEKMR
jgi:hypothetical protein